MKTRKSEIDDLIELLVSSFQKSKYLPYKVKTGKCPLKKKNCTRHHGEIMIKSYNPDSKKFTCTYYGVHVTKSFTYEQTVETIEKIIRTSLTKSRHDNKPLVLVREIKKLLKSDGKFKKYIMHFRCTAEERSIIISNSKKSGLDVSTYMKQKCLS